MDKLSFFKENFKKGNLIIRFENNKEYWRIYELLETYKEGYRWVEAQRYYKNGVLNIAVVGFNTTQEFIEDYGADEYVVIEEFYYD